MSGFVVWFTGLSGAGKSTLGSLLASALRGRGVHVEVLDGDEVRTHLSKGLTFSREDRDTNIRRIGFVAKLLARSGACAITAAISPFRAIRDEQRAQIDRFVEVYCQSSMEALAARDPKGLYRKALAGEIKGFTGIDDPYEEPLQPEVVVYTDRETKEESLAKILAKLEDLGYIAARAGAALGGAKSGLPKPHGGALVSAYVAKERANELAEKAQSLPFVDLDAEAEADVEKIASGIYSPLEGFLTSKDWFRVVAEMRLENGLPWPVPVMLPIAEDRAQKLPIGSEIALRARSGQIVGTVEVSDVYCPEELLRTRTIGGPFGESDPELLRQHQRSRYFAGGKLRAFVTASPGAKKLAPAETRAQFESFEWRYVAAMHAQKALTDADDGTARVALTLTQGLFWQILDWVSYDLLHSNVPTNRVVLSAASVRNAVGPRAAILEGVMAQNFGCSHVVLAQDPNVDLRGAFAHFAPGELGMTPLVFK